MLQVICNNVTIEDGEMRTAGVIWIASGTMCAKGGGRQRCTTGPEDCTSGQYQESDWTRLWKQICTNGCFMKPIMYYLPHNASVIQHTDERCLVTPFSGSTSHSEKFYNSPRQILKQVMAPFTLVGFHWFLISGKLAKDISIIKPTQNSLKVT